MVESFKIPVLLNVFNRPEETQRVLSVLSSVKPTRLYIHCDGPRQGNESDERKIQEVRTIIEKSVIWPCEVHRLYERINLGCGKGPATALNWFFSNEEEGIILEDDCSPNMDFFFYCQDLLYRYKDDDRIGIISGACFNPRRNYDFSYFFSAYAGIWGWATWKRTWDYFDFDFYRSDNDFLSHVIPFVKSRSAARYWLRILHLCTNDGPDRSYWDYQLHLSLLYANKIHIIPNRNLVSNIGFNENATHTLDVNSVYANVPTNGIMPLCHPKSIIVNHRFDNKPYNTSFKQRITHVVKSTIKRVLSVLG